MDPITLAFYGSVCGLLGYASPLLGGWSTRLIFGICTGLIAATVLPIVRGMVVGGAY